MSNYEWKLKDGAPIGLIGAFGVSFEMIPFDRLSDLNASLESDIGRLSSSLKRGGWATKSILDCKNTNEAIYAKAFLAYHVKDILAEKGITSFIEKQNLHDELALEGLEPRELRRALIVQTCENYVRSVIKTIGDDQKFARTTMAITVPKITEECKKKLNFLDESWDAIILRILLEDNWVMFNNDQGKTIIMPYGEMAEGYDSKLGIEHPFWSTIP